ncbi:MAG TPA: phosphoserine phosphatase SerB [Actinomycetes bacterium]|nr:phosphoserine phosphatase SerB [Actinomycetes bacterium]
MLPAPRPRTLLVTLTGHDRPGVTSALFEALVRHRVEVVDLDQVVIHGQLVLAVALGGVRDEPAVRKALVAAADALDMQLEVHPGDEAAPPRRGRSHVTVLARSLTPASIASIAGRIADLGANIDRIVRIAHYPVTAVELLVSGIAPARLRESLSALAAATGVDVAVQPAGLLRRAKRLVVMDVDSTLVQGEVIEMLAEHAGCAERVAELTAAAMRGELDFAAALRERVALFAGLDAAALDAVRREVRLAPGARTLVRTLKRLDHKVGIVSGGFTQVTDTLVAELGLDFAAANTLEVVDGRLTGRLVGPIVDRVGKAAALERFARQAGVPLGQTVAIGDGANDLDMLALAGLGVAFNAKPIVRQAADTSVSAPYLDSVLFLLGITREEIEAADAADGLVTT